MIRFRFSAFLLGAVSPVFLIATASADVQMPTSKAFAPRVTSPTAGSRPATAPRTSTPAAATRRNSTPSPTSTVTYPWKQYVTCTVFWVGEEASGRNRVANFKSSWDQNWFANFGGCDDPDPANRIANHTTGEFRPKAFIPKENPFYVALPYNDVQGWGQHKTEASRVIPWFSRMRPEPGKTVCKGRWVQIYNGSRSCFAQWEDCGPWETDDWEFVFGNKPPKTKQNGSAGIDLSPSIRDYLTLKSGAKVHWRFVDENQVPYGPWMKYGQQPKAVSTPDSIAEQRYLEYLRKLRDEEFQKKAVANNQG